MRSTTAAPADLQDADAAAAAAAKETDADGSIAVVGANDADAEGGAEGGAIDCTGGSGSTSSSMTELATKMVNLAMEQSDSLGICLGSGGGATGPYRTESMDDIAAAAAAAAPAAAAGAAPNRETSEEGNGAAEGVALRGVKGGQDEEANASSGCDDGREDELNHHQHHHQHQHHLQAVEVESNPTSPLTGFPAGYTSALSAAAAPARHSITSVVTTSASGEERVEHVQHVVELMGDVSGGGDDKDEGEDEAKGGAGNDKVCGPTKSPCSLDPTIPIPSSSSPVVMRNRAAAAASATAGAQSDAGANSNSSSSTPPPAASASAAAASSPTSSSSSSVPSSSHSSSSSRRVPRIKVPRSLRRKSRCSASGGNGTSGASGASTRAAGAAAAGAAAAALGPKPAEEVGDGTVEEEEEEVEEEEEEVKESSSADDYIGADGSNAVPAEATHEHTHEQLHEQPIATSGITAMSPTHRIRIVSSTSTSSDNNHGVEEEVEGEVVEEVVVSIIPTVAVTVGGGDGGGGGGGGEAPIVSRTVTTKTTRTVRHRETAVHRGGGAGAGGGDGGGATTRTTETVSTESSARTTTTFPGGADKAAEAMLAGGGKGSPRSDKKPDPPIEDGMAGLVVEDGGTSAELRMRNVLSREERDEVWGMEKVEFAKLCTLEKYVEEEEDCDANEVKGSNSGEGRPSSSSPSSAKSTSRTSTSTSTTKTPSKRSPSLRKSGLGRRSLTSSSAIPSKEIPGRPVPSTSWGPISATKFKVRIGPNYAKYGKKAPSLEGLYETVCVRMYTSGKRTEHVVDVMPLPIEEAFGNDTTSPWGDHGDLMVDAAVPDMLVFHVQMPHDTPSMFKPTEDGKGEEAVVYLRPSKRFVDEMTGKVPMSPASKLFAKWCKACDTDFALRSRFKCMALVRNLEAHNLGWVSPYNGKPVLITESGRARKGNKDGIRFLEMTANVHKWGFLAKKGFVSLLPRFKELRLDIGFTIEAQNDHEMPECMLGAFGANFCDEAKLVAISKDMQKPAA